MEAKKLNFFPVRGISNLLTPMFTKPCQTIGSIPSIPAKEKGSIIQINKNVGHEGSVVFPVQDAYELVDRHGTNNQVGILNCFCRKWRRMMDDPCRLDLPKESCVVVGPGVEHMCDHGFGRKIDKKDALKTLEELAKGGAIHTLFHERDDTKIPNVAVCNCCWDCCGIYGGYNRASIPIYFKSHYMAKVVASDACKACKKCLKYCPINAISLIDDKPVIQENICIGCGQCALQCPTNTFAMKPMNREVLVPMVKESEARIQ